MVGEEFSASKMVLVEVMEEEWTAAPILPAGPVLRNLNGHDHGYACASGRVYGRDHDVRESSRGGRENAFRESSRGGRENAFRESGRGGRENAFRESGRENASAAHDPHANGCDRGRDHDERGRMLRDQQC